MKDRDDCPQPEPADHRFDSLARGLAKSRSRRSVLAGLGVALAGAIGLGRIPVAAEDDYIGEPVDLTKHQGDVYIGTPCGGSYCAEDEYCCNESCGICAPIGGGCTAQYCGETCGPTTCGYGEYCCNASCGVCLPEGYACAQVACETCGDAICQPGEYCCNPLTSTCLPPDMVCAL